MIEINDVIKLIKYFKENDAEEFDKYEIFEERLNRVLDGIDNRLIEIEAGISAIEGKISIDTTVDENLNDEQLPLL